MDNKFLTRKSQFFGDVGKAKKKNLTTSQWCKTYVRAHFASRIIFFADIIENNLKKKCLNSALKIFWLQSNDDDKMTTQEIPPAQKKNGKNDIKIAHWSE